MIPGSSDLGHVLVFAPLHGQQQLGQRLREDLVTVVAQFPDQVLLVLAQLREAVPLHDLLQLDVEFLAPAALRKRQRERSVKLGEGKRKQ